MDDLSWTHAVSKSVRIDKRVYFVFVMLFWLVVCAVVAVFDQGRFFLGGLLAVSMSPVISFYGSKKSHAMPIVSWIFGFSSVSCFIPFYLLSGHCVWTLMNTDSALSVYFCWLAGAGICGFACRVACYFGSRQDEKETDET